MPPTPGRLPPLPRSPQKGAGGNGPEPITDVASTGGRGSDHWSAVPLNKETSSRHLKTLSSPDWLAGPPAETPRAARPLLVGNARQSKQMSPLIGGRPLRPAAKAGADASRRKGSGGRASAPGDAGWGRGRASGRAGRVSGARVRGAHRCAAPRGS